MKERRHAARKRSFLQGRVYYNHHRSSVDCVVRDISDEGAKLVFGEAVAIPDEVELYLPGKEELHRVAVQWRRGSEVGVDFNDLAALSEGETPATAPAAPADVMGRLLKLESEFAILKRTVTELRAELRVTRSEAG
jgi:PilZ domain